MNGNKWLKRLSLGGLLAFLLAILFAHPLVYFGNEIRGKVVDAASGTPLQGVAIVAEWQLYVMLLEPHSGERIKVIEAVTDSAGAYVIAGWGPVIRPPWGMLRNRAPLFTFFKSGYYPKRVLNERTSDTMIRDSEFNGETIQLTRFDGDLGLLSDLLLVSNPSLGGCWRECPHYVIALDAEAKRLHSIVPRNKVFAFPRELETMSDSDRSYFSKYLK